MKIIAIYGSARKNSFSRAAVDYSAEYFTNRGEDVKKYYLSEMNMEPCLGCFACKKKNGCIRKDDMTELFDEIMKSDFVIFSSPVYCFSTNSLYARMFERLYPMLGGGPASGDGFKMYTYIYPKKKCMLILTYGALEMLCHGVRKRTARNLKWNGFDNLGTVVIDGTYKNKKVELTDKQKLKIEKICAKV